MDLITLYLVMFFSGIIFGVVEELCKKIGFIIWIIALTYTIYNVIFDNESLSLEKTYNFSDWYWIGIIFTMFIGYIIGIKLCKKLRK